MVNNNNLSVSLDDYQGTHLEKSFVDTMEKAVRGAPIGTINDYNEIKMPDGSWKWVSKKMRESGEIEKLQNQGKGIKGPTAPVENREGRIPSYPDEPVKSVSGKDKWGETVHATSIGTFGSDRYLSIASKGIGSTVVSDAIVKYVTEDRDFGGEFSIVEGDISDTMIVTSNGNDFRVTQTKPGRLEISRVQSF